MNAEATNVKYVIQYSDGGSWHDFFYMNECDVEYAIQDVKEYKQRLPAYWWRIVKRITRHKHV